MLDSNGTRRGPFQQRFRRRVARAIDSGKIFPFLASTLFSLSLIAGVAITLVDHKEFKNVGEGVWWAIVTLATVGYGDFVPENTPGRVVAAGVIVFGVTFLSVLTATVTSLFIAGDRESETEALTKQAQEISKQNQATLRRIEEQIETITRRLDKPDSAADR